MGSQIARIVTTRKGGAQVLENPETGDEFRGESATGRRNQIIQITCVDVEWIQPAQGTVRWQGFCERGNEPWEFHKRRERLSDGLNDY
jgi:hypothetical protein